MRCWLILSLLCLPAMAVEKAAYDSNARIIALLSDAEDLEVTTNLVAVLPSGKRVPLQVRIRRDGEVLQGIVRKGSALAWSGTFRLPDGGRGRMELEAAEDASGVRYSATVSAQTPLTVDAIEFVVDLPQPAFLNGWVSPEGSWSLPLAAVKPPDPALYRGETSAMHIQDATGNVTLDLAFDSARPAAVVDRWDAQGRSYQVRVALQRGDFAADASASVATTLRLTNKSPVPAPARLAIDTSKPRYRFDGFGGNYCWNNLSPVSAYTLKNLKLAWARTEMKALQWDRQRDNPGPEIRADFETMRRFQEMGVPYVISIWWLPERFYTDPYEKPRMGHFRIIKPEKWDELLELLGSYLLYAKREYSVEPDLFSFNEANIGVYVGLTPETHTEVIKRIGAYFRKLGLKTRMLLGDATGPRDTHRFVLEAASDPEAMQFVGAVGFHSWGGGTPEQYTAWGDVGQWLNLPLLVTELGVDAAAYYTQFTDLTPHKSEALETSSDQRSILFTAFRKDNRYALHILNLGGEREATLEGLPDAEWQSIETTETAQYQNKPPIPSKAGTLLFTLPSRSLVSLTAQVEPGRARTPAPRETSR